MWMQNKTQEEDPNKKSPCERPEKRKKGKKNPIFWKKEERLRKPGAITMFTNTGPGNPPA